MPFVPAEQFVPPLAAKDDLHPLRCELGNEPGRDRCHVRKWLIVAGGDSWKDAGRILVRQRHDNVLASKLKSDCSGCLGLVDAVAGMADREGLNWRVTRFEHRCQDAGRINS